MLLLFHVYFASFFIDLAIELARLESFFEAANEICFIWLIRIILIIILCEDQGGAEDNRRQK